jgi:hypothetical protein
MDQLNMEAPRQSPSQNLRPYPGPHPLASASARRCASGPVHAVESRAVSLLILLAGRIWPIERPWFWALIPLAAWLIGVVGFAFLRPLSLMRVARQVDLELHLKERISTSLALEKAVDSPVFTSFKPELVEKTHDDALHTARQVNPYP